MLQHQAPAVRYPVGRSGWPWAMLGALALAMGATGIAWVQSDAVAPAGLPQGLYLILAAVLLGWACRDAWLAPRGHLVWDGASWSWEDGSPTPGALATPFEPAAATRLEQHLDGQSWMLLSLRTPGAARRWLWLQRRQDPSQWLALRRAVVGLGGVAEPDAERSA